VVQQVHVVEGQAVKAGDTLATIFSRDALALASERARAEARLSLARANAARIGQLADEGVVAAARADEARAALREAEVQVAEAERVLGRTRASADGIMRLVAPIDGRVSHVAVETGGPLDGMAAPFVIDGGKDYALELQLPERLAGRVRPGMPVLLPGGERGVLISVGSGLDPATRSITAIARLEGPAGFLSGSALSVTILSATGVEAVVVPTAAVTRIDGEDALFVKKGDGFQPLKVVPGGSAGGKTTILDGVEAGAVVAISGLPELRAAAGH
jgi:cobalt-zinc-cadmium efflux system membrane fusion protein